MKFGKIALAGSAASLAATPAAFAAERVSAPVEGESEMGGSGIVVAAVFGLLAIALFVAVGGEDEPVSP